MGSTLFYILAVIVLLFGASVGSFLSALAVRLNPEEKKSKKETFLTRSNCDTCGYKLEIIDLFPIFSYAFLRGKCRKCDSKIPLHFWIMEVVTGLVALAIFLKTFGFGYEQLIATPNLAIAKYVFWTLSAFIAVYLAYFDFLYWEIPLWFTIFLFGFGVILSTLLWLFGITELNIFTDSLIAMFVGIGIIAVLIFASRGKGLGWGDAWIFGLVGLSRGLVGLGETFFLAVTIGAIIGLLVIYLERKKLHGSMIQFIPFISLGFIISYLFDNIVLQTLMPFIA